MASCAFQRPAAGAAIRPAMPDELAPDPVLLSAPGFASNRLPSVKKQETLSAISFSTGRLICNMASMSN